MTTQRYEKIIGGRTYRIEAARVHANKWRAQIVHIPGMPTALMPFYGPTAEEAARGLTVFLMKLHHIPPPVA